MAVWRQWIFGIDNGGCDQQNNDKLHIFLSLYICAYAQSTVSTGMSCSSVSRWGSI